VRGPVSWRALPFAVRTDTLRRARRGLPAPDPAVRAAALEWARWTRSPALALRVGALVAMLTAVVTAFVLSGTDSALAWLPGALVPGWALLVQRWQAATVEAANG
jgi:hypothetical protein